MHFNGLRSWSSVLNVKVCLDVTFLAPCSYYYRPQRSCGKVVFLHLSVILFTGEGCLFTICNKVAKVMFLQVCVCPWGRGACSIGVPGPRGVYPGGVPGPGGACSRGVPGPKGSAPGGAWSQGVVVSQHALRQKPPPQERQLLLWMVCILLECILVTFYF